MKIAYFPDKFYKWLQKKLLEIGRIFDFLNNSIHPAQFYLCIQKINENKLNFMLTNASSHNKTNFQNF